MPGSNIQKNITRPENGRNVLDAKKSAIAALSWFSCDGLLAWILRPIAVILAGLYTWNHTFADWGVNYDKLDEICVDKFDEILSCKLIVPAYTLGLTIASMLVVFGIALASASVLSILHRRITGDSKADSDRSDEVGGKVITWTVVLVAGLALYGFLSYLSYTKEIGLTSKPAEVTETSEISKPYVSPQPRYNPYLSDLPPSRYGSSSSSSSNSSSSSSYPHPEVTYFDSDGRPCPIGTGISINRNTGDRTCNMSGK